MALVRAPGCGNGASMKFPPLFATFIKTNGTLFSLPAFVAS
jgi:hypothetical protein